MSYMQVKVEESVCENECISVLISLPILLRLGKGEKSRSKQICEPIKGNNNMILLCYLTKTNPLPLFLLKKIFVLYVKLNLDHPFV